MMSSDLELPDSVYGIIDDCGFTSTLDVIKQNNNKKISKYIPQNLFPTMLNVGTKIWGSFDLSDADACNPRSTSTELGCSANSSKRAFK